MKDRILFALSLAAIVAFCIFSYLYLDIAVASYFYEVKPLNAFFEIVTVFGNPSWYLIAFAILFLLFRYIFALQKAANRFLYLFLSVVGSGLIVDILKFVFGRARPKLFFEQNIYGIKFFGTQPLYFSLPSGHSATAFSLAVGAAIFFPRFAVPAFTAAVLVAFSRIAITAHYLSDIVAGAYIAIVFGIWLKHKMIQKGVRF